MTQINKHKVKSLSPAISAFQFQLKSTGCSSLVAMEKQDGSLLCTTPSATPGIEQKNDYFSHASYQSSPDTPPPPQEQHYIQLSEETKQKLSSMQPLPLDAEWTFWYDKFVPNLPATEYESNLKIISSVKTVQKFWSIYNNIDEPDKLGFRSNYHFMKKGIKPIWEDPMNEYGGSYNFKIDKKQSPHAWREILVLLIGENVEGWIKNNVFGVSVSSRQHVHNYQIWTAHGNKNIQDNIVRAKLEELLDPVVIQSFYFKMHKTHADFQPSSTPTTPTLLKTKQIESILLRPIEMRRKITEENIEKVVQDIEKLKIKERENFKKPPRV